MNDKTLKRKLKELEDWGKEKGFYYVCLSCGKTKNKVNKDGECMECAR